MGMGMSWHDALATLQEFVHTIVNARVTNRKLFSAWCRSHEAEMEQFFGYERKDKMPSIASLVTASFHPAAPLIMLNYTGAAHNLLHAYPDGWTWGVRHCRGIVFDTDGVLVAHPFSKFFNYGEHPETQRNALRGSFTATQKYDGHLGIIFRYKGKLYITTRGDFESPTAKMAQCMLDRYAAQHDWLSKIGEGFTLLVEIIHPSTEVFVDYDGREEFVLLTFRRNGENCFFPHVYTRGLGEQLGLSVTEQWCGDSVGELIALMRDRLVSNKEGYVAYFGAQKIHVKFKFMTYINKMVEKKLGYKYLMQRMIAGNLNKMIGNLPEEILERARRMCARLRKIARDKTRNEKEKRQMLYALVPEEESTSYYRAVCRNFLKASIT
ncbi:MAG: hypothetical protein KGI50_02580 [Patescibacteria group bacterium]|nr:hypothetical protein [Patescibacteria group bacterium]MDE2438602.1 hypothetical protein [Patescibacteria group bacterium]